MMKTGTLLIAGILAAQLCTANELQQKYEKAYYLETAKGQAKQAAALYRAISEAEPTEKNKPAIKQSLLRLLHMATVRKHESTIKDCHEKLLQKTDATIQELVDATKAGGTVYIPAGKYEGTVTIGNKLTLKGENRETCILFATADRPLIHIPKRQEATLESLSLKSQMATSERSDPPAYTLVVQDAKATVIDCDFGTLGNAKRSPCAVVPMGFSEVDLRGCRFVGYEYTISYSGGAKGSVKDCIVMNPGHHGIMVGNDCEVEITGNIVTGSRYHGVRCTGGTLTVKDNLIINNRDRGIYLGNKPVQGEVSNNAIVGNGKGISSFSYTEVEIENNVILGNQRAGLDTHGSCRIEVANNIFAGNKKTGFVVYEGNNKRFRVGKNTFWENGTPSIDFKLPSSTLEADPQFTNPDKGNFAVGNSKIKSAKHGLTNPEIISNLWKKYAELDGNNAKALSDEIRTLMAASKESEKATLQKLMDSFDMKNGDLDEVLRTFGKPKRYFFGDKTYTKENLPIAYLISYPQGFRICMNDDEIEEFRFEKKTDYKIAGITVGTSLEKVLKTLGKPKRTVNGRECTYEERILFKNSKGRPNGHAYYSAKGLRLFFMHDEVIALYITDNTQLGRK